MNKKERTNFRKKSCDGKIKHESYLAAEYYLYNISSRSEEVEIYKCIFCNKFHLGHTTKSPLKHKTVKKR